MSDDPVLNPEEREAISSGAWFASLSPSLRHDILRVVQVKRFADGALIGVRGERPEAWMACAKGAVRICGDVVSGKQVTLTYIEPGVWFGEHAIFDGDQRTHDSYAHGETTVVCVSRKDFADILARHVELYEALLRQSARSMRMLLILIEDLNSLPLRARLAKHLVYLLRSHGTSDSKQQSESRIGLNLAQESLAQLLGASRQRVNHELKQMEREALIRVEPSSLIVRDVAGLIRIGQVKTT